MISPWVIVLSLIMILAQVPMIHQLILWDRDFIIQGQWWRILTGNLTHTNEIHLGMNLAALVALALLHRQYYRERCVVLLVWGAMPIIGLGMFFTNFSTYAGLSGVLHGLFAWGVIRDIQNQLPFSRLLLFGLLAKLCWEVYSGSEGATSALIEAHVAYQAHWIGAVTGGIVAVCFPSSRILVRNEEKK